MATDINDEDWPVSLSKSDEKHTPEGGDEEIDAAGGVSLEHKLFHGRHLTEATARGTEETKAILRDARRLGPERALVSVPDDYVDRCLRLEQDFPNFAEYISEFLLPELALERARGGVIKVSPTVFLGAPGIGKTLFVSAFCEAFGIPHLRINLETSAAGFEVIGSARHWSNAAPGRIFRWIAGGSERANGVVIFEELDKAKGDHRFDVTAPLIQLLEPTTAKCFEDACVPEMPLDLRPLNYLFTANSLEGVSEPILSRLIVVEIPSLTPAQAKEIALRQYETLIDTLGLNCKAPTLTDEALALLGEESPRRQRHLLRLALGRSLFQKSPEITIKADKKKTTRMGFC